MNKNEFENYLKDGNVTKRFLEMSSDELKNMFGEEFLKTVNFGSQNNTNHQYDLFEHILRTVDNIQAENLKDEDLIKIKVAAFFHDIGKPNVAQLNEKTDQTQFIGHAKESANIANEILSNLGYSEDQINELNFLIQCHDDFINISKLEDVTPSRISKIISSMNKKLNNYQPKISDIKNLIILCKADASAQNDVITKNGEISDTKQDRIARLEAVEQVLEEAIVLKSNQEIEKLQKQKETIKNGPKPINKNGKIVNQKQIDLWNAKTDEQKQQEISEIDKSISLYEKEKAVLLEIDEHTNSTSSQHEAKAAILTETINQSKQLSEEIKQLENSKGQNK